MANFPVVPFGPEGKDQDGRHPPRLEIDDFMKPENAKQVFLFVAALTKIQDMKASDALSFFQLGGIHGRPYREWPPVGGDNENDKFMYCHHGTAQFPTWHRVYVLLYERTLYDIMRTWVHPETKPSDSPIPPESRNGYREAALTWRLPFWDIGTRKPYNDQHLSIPKCATSENLDGMGNAWKALNSSDVKDAAPEWLKTHTRNPLYTFRYPNDRAKYGLRDDMIVFNRDTSTRYPDRKNAGKPNIIRLLQYYKDNSKTPRNDISQSFTIENFNAFNGYTRSGKPNLQSAHANGHNFTGGGGNMTYLDYAGFDPLFFHHHANIDRLIALWQAGHPGNNPNFWLSTTEEQVPLSPFKNKKGELWTSAQVKEISELGYSYEATRGVNNIATLTQRVKDLFGDDDEVIRYDVIPTAAFEISEIGPFEIKFRWMKGQEEKPDSDPVVGSVINFVANRSAPCETCERNREERTRVTLSTNLSPRLVENDLYGAAFKDMTRDTIEQETGKCLYWRVYKNEATGPVEIPVSEFKSLKIAVQAWYNDGTLVGHGPEAGKPKSEPTRLSGVTSGKPGGLEAGEPLPWEE